MAATHSLDVESSSSQYASIADASCPNLEITGSQTWECWVKPEAFSGFQYPMGKVDTLATIFKNFFFNSSGQLTFVLNGLTTNDSVSSTYFLSAGFFTHVAGVYDSVAGKLRLYINGDLNNEVSASGSTVDSNASFSIGRGGDYNGNYFDGMVRNARIWNVARTQSEIRANMNLDTPSITTGLQANWILNNTYTDSSVNGYNLTASGSPVFATEYPDSISFVENGGWNGKHKIIINADQVSGSADFTDFPIVLTGDNFFETAFENTQGQEINTNNLLSDSTLKAYYRFESGAETNDSSGEGHGLTLVNAPTGTTGKFGNGLQLVAASTQYATVADHADFDMATGDYSVGCWIKKTSNGWYGSMIGNVSATDQFGFSLAFQSSNRIEFNAAGASANNVVTTDTYTSTTEWLHVVGTRDSTNLKIYVNGVLVASSLNTGQNVTSATALTIGPYRSGAPTVNLVDGIVDDIFITKGKALTQAEVEKIYKGGADLRFSVDSDGKERLSHEIVSWDVENQEAEVWVKVNSLLYNSDTELFVHYGNSTATSLGRVDAFGRNQVWHSNYKGVWHFQESANTRYDSTINSNDLADNNTVTSATGKLGVGADFEAGNSEYFSKTDNTSLSFTGDITISGWFKWESLTGGEMTMVGKYESSPSSSYLLLWNDSGDNLQFYASNNGTSVSNVNASFTPTLDTWYHIAVIYDASAGEARIYVNGVDIGGGTGLPTNIYDSATAFRIGAYNATAQSFFDGMMDEIRTVAEEKTPDWITTEYNNQNSPGTFAIPNSSFVPKMAVLI